MDPWRDAVALHRRLAYVPGDVSLWPNLTGGEVIDLLGRLRGGLNPQRRAELIEMFDLDPTKKTRAYSKGNRQKVALISALSSDVELLLLDEPTAGLDPLMESMFRGVINDWRGDGSQRPAEQPHPVRGGGALRPAQHHPGRPRRRDGHPGPAAPPAAHVGHRGAAQRAAGPGVAAGPARRGRSTA